jgi:hypothetical protein
MWPTRFYAAKRLPLRRRQGPASPRAEKLQASLVERIGVFYLRPMAAALHLEDGRIRNELDDGSGGFEKYVLVIDRGDNERRGAQPLPVFIRYPVPVVNVRIEQRLDVRDRCFHVGAAVDR